MKDLGLSRLFFPSAHVFRNVAATNANTCSILVEILTWLARTVNWAQRLGKIEDMRSHQHLPKSTATLQLSKMVLLCFIILCLHPSCLERLSAVVCCRDCRAFEAKSDEDRWAPLIPSCSFRSRPCPVLHCACGSHGATSATVTTKQVDLLWNEPWKCNW